MLIWRDHLSDMALIIGSRFGYFWTNIRLSYRLRYLFQFCHHHQFFAIFESMISPVQYICYIPKMLDTFDLFNSFEAFLEILYKHEVYFILDYCVDKSPAPRVEL